MLKGLTMRRFFTTLLLSGALVATTQPLTTYVPDQGEAR